MKRERHLTWENFRDTFIEPAAPALHPIPGKPHVHLFIDAGAGRIGLRLPEGKGSQVPTSPLRTIELSKRTIDRQKVIEISTTCATLYPQFYHLAIDVSDRVQLKGEPAASALVNALADWNALLKAAQLLSLEQRLGLMGELWLLERLIAIQGPASIASWIGPKGEPHDFRLGTKEFEVKATTSPHRDHMINGDAQLVPTHGCQLFILSVQLAPSGAGQGLSLPHRVARIRELLRHSPGPLKEFDNGVQHMGYSDGDASYYPEAWILRTKPVLVPVNEACPRISSALLLSAFGPAGASRVREIHYRLNVDGLGFKDGTADFLKLIPGPRLTRPQKD